jgi:hypothetical protein
MLFHGISHLPCLFPWSLVLSSHALPCLLLYFSWSPPMLFHVISHLSLSMVFKVFSSHALLCLLSSYVINGLLLLYALPCHILPSMSLSMVSFLLSCSFVPILCYSYFFHMLFHVSSHLPCLFPFFSFLFPCPSVSPPILFIVSSYDLPCHVPPSLSLSILQFSPLMPFRVSSYVIHGLLLCSSMSHLTFHVAFYGLQFSPPMPFLVTSYVIHGLLLCSSMSHLTFHVAFYGLQFSPPMPFLVTSYVINGLLLYAFPCLSPPSMSLSMVFSFSLPCSSVFPRMLFHVTSHLPCLLLCYSRSPPICSSISYSIHVSFHGLQFSPAMLLRVPSYVIYGLLICSSMSHLTFHVAFYGLQFSPTMLFCVFSPPMLFIVSSYMLFMSYPTCLFLWSSKFSPPVLLCVSSPPMLFMVSSYSFPCFIVCSSCPHTLFHVSCLIAYSSMSHLIFFCLSSSFLLYLFCALLLLLMHSSMSPNTSNASCYVLLCLALLTASLPGHGLLPREHFMF